MTSSYAAVVEQLGIEQWCRGGCGITVRSHRTGFLFLGAIHWTERRVSRRGLRRFFLLIAQREREADPGYLNERRFAYLYLYLDEMRANDLAGLLGVRFPIEFSRTERWKCLWLAHKAKARITRAHPAAYAWSVRGLA